jgi:hypothetical protein
MSLPPGNDQPAVPAPDGQPRRMDNAPLPLPYEQDMWSRPDERLTLPEEFSVSTMTFGNEPTIPIRPVGPRQKRRLRPWWWALWLLLALVLGVLLGLSPFFHMEVKQPTSSPTSGALVRASTVTRAATRGTPHATASATARSGKGSGTPVSATVTATPRATATPPPTATAVAGQFSVSPLTIQQKCSLVLPLPSFFVTLSNQTKSSVGYQVTVVTHLPGTSTPWASITPASGSVPAGAQQRVDVTPNSKLCTDSLFHGTQPFVLRVMAVSGTSDAYTVTDNVTSAP